MHYKAHGQKLVIFSWFFEKESDTFSENGCIPPVAEENKSISTLSSSQSERAVFRAHEIINELQ